MRTLLITQTLDPADPLLGFTVGWVRALAARVDRLDVLTLAAPPSGLLLPPNVRSFSMGKESGKGRLAMLREFVAVVRRLAPHTDVIFSHMVPRYAWLAALIAPQTPGILWYTQEKQTVELRLALRLVHQVVTAVPESFPLRGRKVRAIGHGIDPTFFTPTAQPPQTDLPLILQVGRLSPIKGQHTVIKALQQPILEGLAWQMVFIGGTPNADSQAYAAALKDRAAQAGLSERITFTGALPPEAVRDYYQRAWVALNVSPPGLFDKAALEGLLMGVPTLVTNPAFATLYGDDETAKGWILPEKAADQSAAFALRLRDALRLPLEQRHPISERIRANTLEQHSLPRLMDRLIGVFQEVVR